MPVTDSEQPLVQNPEGWGSMKDVLDAPLQGLTGANSWPSVIGMWIFFIPNIIIGLIGGFCSKVYVCYAIGCCCLPGSNKCGSVMGLVNAGSPLYLAWIWWRAAISGLTILLSHGGSRLGMFLWEWAAFGSADYFWHGEGIWNGKYENCETILKGVQKRSAAFGCVTAPVPDLFASNLLIFLSNEGPESEWAELRKLLHEFFLNQGAASYKKRTAELAERINIDWPNGKLSDTSDALVVDKAVAKSVFYVMFGIWIEDSEAELLSRWRSYAGYFVLPRLVQRLAFNLLINKVKQLRADTVGLVEKYGQQQIFIDMNNKLSERYRRPTAVELCDQMMFVVGFAGIGGTCALVESTASFLQCKVPKGSAGAKYIKWGEYASTEKMVAKYKDGANGPENYLREVARMDPPVTSACCTLKEETKVTLAGQEFTLPAGYLQQYVVSMANRDETLFPEPSVFNPDRANLKKSLSWNGAFEGPNDEAVFPRICPGRWLSLTIAKAVINNAINHADDFSEPVGSGQGCCGPK